MKKLIALVLFVIGITSCGILQDTGISYYSNPYDYYGRYWDSPLYYDYYSPYYYNYRYHRYYDYYPYNYLFSGSVYYINKPKPPVVNTPSRRVPPSNPIPRDNSLNRREINDNSNSINNNSRTNNTSTQNQTRRR